MIDVVLTAVRGGAEVEAWYDPLGQTIVVVVPDVDEYHVGINVHGQPQLLDEAVLRKEPQA